MKVKFLYLLPIIALFSLSSCAHRLVGTWTVQKYESESPGKPGVSVQNVGTISFDKDGTGRKVMNYSILGVEKHDSTPFQWSVTDSYITIDGEGSDISKTWIFVENKGKRQHWKSTDGENQVQTLELVKQ